MMRISIDSSSSIKKFCFENHGQDSRVRPIDVAPTIPSKAGTGGNNLPIVLIFAKKKSKK